MELFAANRRHITVYVVADSMEDAMKQYKESSFAKDGCIVDVDLVSSRVLVPPPPPSSASSGPYR